VQTAHQTFPVADSRKRHSHSPRLHVCASKNTTNQHLLSPLRHRPRHPRHPEGVGGGLCMMYDTSRCFVWSGPASKSGNNNRFIIWRRIATLVLLPSAVYWTAILECCVHTAPPQVVSNPFVFCVEHLMTVASSFFVSLRSTVFNRSFLSLLLPSVELFRIVTFW
jgi:hypothetical protein